MNILTRRSTSRSALTSLQPSIRSCRSESSNCMSGWPRKIEHRRHWPSSELQRSVKAKGVMVVAKQNFYWSASFAECEKELSKHADGDGGNRKQVHRLVKAFHERFWKKETKHLTSYMIKVNLTKLILSKTCLEKVFLIC